MTQEDIRLAFQEIKKACGHNKYISLDFSISRFERLFNSQREEMEFSIYDNENDISVAAPNLDLLVKKYMLAMEEKHALQAVAS